MPELDNAAGSPGADEAAADTSNAGDEAGAGDDAVTGGVTEAEVRSTLRNSGIKLPAEPTAAADDDEEGDDVDAADDAGVADDDAGNADEDLADDGKSAPTDEEIQAAQDAKSAEAADKYSFEVTDANGVTFKVPVDATMEDVLAEFEPKNNGQVIDILEKLREMKEQKAKDDASEADETAKAETAQRASEIRKSWDAEVTDLTAQKRLPTGEDGEKRTAEVYKFMAAENDKRMQDGKATLNSFEDALDKLEAKEGRDAKVAADKKEKEDARKNGSLVGGSSAASTNATPVYKAGAAKNANAALRSMGLI